MVALKYRDPVTGEFVALMGPGPTGPTGPGVPPAGLTGEVLTKQSDADLDTAWEPLPPPPLTLPAGGAVGAVLRKETAADGEADWAGNIVMGAGETIQFPNAVGDKINVYAADFGVGVNSSELALYASGKVGFRDKGFDGTQWGYVDSAGMVSAGRRVSTGKEWNGLAITTGTYYKVCNVGSAGACQFSLGAVYGDRSHAHVVVGSCAAGYAASTGVATFSIFGNSNGHGKVWDRMAVYWVNSTYTVAVRAAVTASVNVGLVAWDLVNGNPNAWDMTVSTTGTEYGAVAL